MSVSRRYNSRPYKKTSRVPRVGVLALCLSGIALLGVATHASPPWLGVGTHASPPWPGAATYTKPVPLGNADRSVLGGMRAAPGGDANSARSGARPLDSRAPPANCNSPVQLFPSNSTPQGIASDGTDLWVAHFDGTVARFRASDGCGERCGHSSNH